MALSAWVMMKLGAQNGMGTDSSRDPPPMLYLCLFMRNSSLSHNGDTVKQKNTSFCHFTVISESSIFQLHRQHLADCVSVTGKNSSFQPQGNIHVEFRNQITFILWETDVFCRLILQEKRRRRRRRNNYLCFCISFPPSFHNSFGK